MALRVALIAALVAGVLSMPGAARQPQAGTPGMHAMHEQMMAEMAANRGTLDALVTTMNAASGTAKVDAIAAAVTELVRQQHAMHARMGLMHEQMMSGRGMMGGNGRGMMNGR